MSRFSDSKTAGRRCAAVALIAALACTGATLASDDPLDAVTVRVQGAEPPGEARSASGSDHTPEERPAPAPGKSAKSPRSLFRCWQGGLPRVYCNQAIGARATWTRRDRFTCQPAWDAV